MVPDGIFASTVEFLLKRVDKDPVALLRAVADYLCLNKVGRSSLVCSKECLLRAAATTSQSNGQEQRCSQCQKAYSSFREAELDCRTRPYLKEASRDGVESSGCDQLEQPLGVSAEGSSCISGAAASLHASSDVNTHLTGHEEHQSKELECGADIEVPCSSESCETSKFNEKTNSWVTPAVLIGDILSQLENASKGHGSIATTVAPAAGLTQAMGRATSAVRVSFEVPKSQSVSMSQEGARDSLAAGASNSTPFVPSLALKGLDVSGSVSARGEATSPRFTTQSARGPRPCTSLQSPRTYGGLKAENPLTDRPRPHTSTTGRGYFATEDDNFSQSGGSSPQKDRGVKLLMTPDEHINEWLAEKKRKEAHRQRRIRRRQLAELEFIAALRKTQARRLRRLQEEEGTLERTASSLEALSNKQTAQARYRGLTGSIEKLPSGALVSRSIDGSR